jgi:hypothetical protein
MSGALASLRMLFAARIAALALTRQDNRAAALVVLEAERDAALAELVRRLTAEKRRALRAVRRARRRYRIALPRLSSRPRPTARYPSP